MSMKCSLTQKNFIRIEPRIFLAMVFVTSIIFYIVTEYGCVLLSYYFNHLTYNVFFMTLNNLLMQV